MGVLVTLVARICLVGCGVAYLFRLWRTRRAAQRDATPPQPRRRWPICLEEIASTTRAHSYEKPHASSIKLTLCGHTFCRNCIHPYVDMKVRERLVEWDQLQCPVVECKRSLNDRDLLSILDLDGFQRYKHTLLRVRDEKNPLARWCINPQCGELMVCEANTTRFTCPNVPNVCGVG